METEQVVSYRDKPIYTLGTSTRSPQEFTGLLKSYGIEVIVDVRRFPTSRFEYFHGAKLARILNEAGIGYVYMGQQLGGFRRGGYLAFTATAEFLKVIVGLEEVAQGGKAAIVCAERLPWRCHRRYIGLELEKRGWQVIHVVEQGRVWLPGKTMLVK